MRIRRKEGKKVNKYKMPQGTRKPEVMIITQEDIEELEYKVKQLQDAKEIRNTEEGTE